MQKWMAGVAATVVSGIIVYWLTIGIQTKHEPQPTPKSPSPQAINSEPMKSTNNPIKEKEKRETGIADGKEVYIVDHLLWYTDTTGVCRDNEGKYPRWSAYNWTLQECEENCMRNPKCQGFAMSKTQNYCQLMGSDGSRPASKPGTRITRGDSSQPQYTCYLKKIKHPLIWKIDSTGVCRDNEGKHPRWSAYNWTLQECEENCMRNPKCQGFAMSKTQNYCQLMGSDGSRPASKPGTRITRGDSSQPQYTCYLKH